MTRYLQFLRVPCASFQCANHTVAMFNQQEAGINLAKAEWLNYLFFKFVCFYQLCCWCLLPAWVHIWSFWRKPICIPVIIENVHQTCSCILLNPSKPVRCQVKTKRIKPFVCSCLFKNCLSILNVGGCYKQLKIFHLIHIEIIIGLFWWIMWHWSLE